MSSGRREVIRAWQIADCITFDCRLGWTLDSLGWKLLRVDEIRLISPLPLYFLAPRPGYERGDKDIWLMFREL
jgi:hypothetical protein